jgi:hypothetical protein
MNPRPTLPQPQRQTASAAPCARNQCCTQRRSNAVPFVCHQGEIRLAARGERTDLTWTIRFRPKVPRTGRLLAAGFSRVLDHIMRSRLKPTIESRATTGTFLSSTRTANTVRNYTTPT